MSSPLIVFEWLMAGKKIRYKTWYRDDYIFMDGNSHIINQDGNTNHLFIESDGSGWSLFEEEQEKECSYCKWMALKNFCLPTMPETQIVMRLVEFCPFCGVKVDREVKE